jgi:glucan phosphoethanolaminetransferase (alkaline phosphatase superfamily)
LPSCTTSQPSSGRAEEPIRDATSTDSARAEAGGRGGLRLLTPRQLRVIARWRRLLAALLLVLPPLLVLLVDLGQRGDRLLDLRGKYILSYGASLLESAALWGTLLFCASARRGLGRWIAAVVLVVLATLSIGGQIYFHGQYSTYLNLDATLFGTSVAGAAFEQVGADSLHFISSVGPVLLGAVVLIWLGRILVRPRRRAARVACAVAPVVVVAAFLIPCSYRSIQGSTPDVIYLHAMGGLIKQLSGARSAAEIRPKRRTPPALPQLNASPARPRNVVFILLEGVRADAACSAPNEPCPTMPATQAATPERIGLRQMRADSSATAIELAVMWTGLPPTAGREELHSAPVIFDYAHAAGLETAYWSSHHMMFANSRHWVQDLPTRFQCGATQLDPLADIDLGADDRLLTARVQRELPQLQEPFFAVVHYGNTHMPFLIDEQDAPFQPQKNSRAPDDNDAFRNRYLNAVYRQDQTIAELVRFVRDAPFGERTVVMLTSDHGEGFREHGQLGHTSSLFDVEIHVPMWLDAPPGTLTDEEREALESYRSEPVFHSDLAPTQLDLIGLAGEPSIASYRAKMVGSSLLRKGRPERTVAMTNCAGVWGCAFENWGVMRGWRKVHAREWDTSWLCYDLKEDPDELAPLDLDSCRSLVDEAERIYGGLPGKL